MSGTSSRNSDVLDLDDSSYPDTNIKEPDLLLIKNLRLVLAMLPQLWPGTKMPVELLHLYETLRKQPDIRLSDEARYKITVLYAAASRSLLVHLIDLTLTRLLQMPIPSDVPSDDS